MVTIQFQDILIMRHNSLINKKNYRANYYKNRKKGIVVTGKVTSVFLNLIATLKSKTLYYHLSN